MYKQIRVFIMSSRIYAPISVHCLDVLPIDIHFVISKYLGFSHHMYVYINLVDNSKVSKEIKKHIYYECFPNYTMYKSLPNINDLFEKYVIDNIHNIVELHKVMPLVYKRSRTRTITCDENIRLNTLLTHGYNVEYESDSDDDDVDFTKTYKLCKKPILFEITKGQCMAAFIAQHLDYETTYINDNMKVILKGKRRSPCEMEVKEYLRKIKKRNMRLM